MERVNACILKNDRLYFGAVQNLNPMKNRIVQLTHRFPALEYVFNIVLFFAVSLLLVLALIFFAGLLSGA
jgi:hypothetical protein